ncbi:MAG: efflux RND transporter periplasmic adaptor subunit [Bryobacteraceae bacterium]|nr:efflux RND transporter periplasmic adaptor subunit [Bryobacteraceae bacterium]
MRRILLVALALSACQRAPETTKAAAEALHEHGAHEHGPEEAGVIHFSQEQQKLLGFEVGLVVERELREELRIPAEVRARATGIAEVTAPLAGRLAIDTPLELGANVTKGTVLAGVLPPTNAAADLPTLELAEAEARAELGHAKVDRERAERLVKAGAASEHRLEVALLEETTAKARLAAAEARLKQYEASREAEGREQGVRRFLIRAPIDGVVSQILAVHGANVEEHAPLFRLVDASSVTVVGALPEANAHLAQTLRTARIEHAGETTAAGGLLTVGRLLDSETRTLPITFALDNRGRRFAIGQAVTLALPTARTLASTAVLESALVDEGAAKVVYVRRDNEHFERRPVRTGIRSGDFVEILEGVAKGDRVAVKGAYLLRLASAGGGVPDHGHVH